MSQTVDLSTQTRIYRAAYQVSQKQLAKRLKVSQTALSLWENGKAPAAFDPVIIKKLSDIIAEATS